MTQFIKENRGLLTVVGILTSVVLMLLSAVGAYVGSTVSGLQSDVQVHWETYQSDKVQLEKRLSTSEGAYATIEYRLGVIDRKLDSLGATARGGT